MMHTTRTNRLNLMLCALLGLNIGCWLGDDGVGDSDAATGLSETTDTTGITGVTGMTSMTSMTSMTGMTAASTGTSTPTTSSETTDNGTTSSPVFCSDADSCPEVLCRSARCESGVCAYDPLADGEIIDNEVGDCRQTQCDGEGGGEVVAADDPPEDTVGDCKKTTCDAGEIVYVAADDDLPDDDLECTTDTCDAGEQVFTPKPKGTFCGPMGAHYCHDDAVCRRCKQLDDLCDDPGPEPNETQSFAHDLGKIGDADSAGDFVCGTVAGDDDVDWYVFEGDDTIFGAVDPTRFIDAKNGARVCVYAECIKGSTFVSCGNLTPDTAPLGQEGCCGSGKVAPNLECGGLDDAAMIWIRVDEAEQECLPYDLDYHF